MMTAKLLLFFPELLMAGVASLMLMLYSFTTEDRKLYNYGAIAFAFASSFIMLIYGKSIALSTTILGAGLLWYGEKENENWNNNFESFALVLIIFAGAGFAIESDNALMMYIGLEMVSIPSYILVAMGRGENEHNNTTEAAIKYFILGALASVFMLMGISYLYLASGTFNFNTILLEALSQGKIGVFGSIMIVVGLLMKAAVFPFHAWAPDAYFVSNIRNLIVFSVVPKLAAILVLVKLAVLTANINEMNLLVSITLPIAAISLLFGAIMALKQTSIARIMAYGGIFNAGYILLSLLSLRYNVTGDMDSTLDLIKSINFFFFVYSIATIAFVAVLASLKIKDSETISINNIEGLWHKNKLRGFAAIIALFSMMGLPPLAGFFGKFFIFASILLNDLRFMPFTIITILGVIVMAFTYLRLIHSIYAKKIPANQAEHQEQPTALADYIAIIAAIILITAPLWHDTIIFIT